MEVDSQGKHVDVHADSQNLAHLEPLSRREIKKVRHKAEPKLYALCVIITVLAVLVAILFAADDYLDDEHFSEEAPSIAVETNEAQQLDEEDEEDYLFMIIFGPIVLLAMLYLYYAYTRAYAIKVSEKNFPEIYDKSVEFAKRLGLSKVPPVYIEQHNGVLNAFASAVIRKPYAMLTAELVDIAYMEHKDFSPVFYVLAHEMAHIYFKHVNFGNVLMTFIPHMIPVFGPLHSRSMEYSCDRVAQLLMGRDCVEESMILAAGRHLYKYVDTEDYLDNARREKGFFLWVVNLMASHPIMTKRTLALADPKKRSGKLF